MPYGNDMDNMLGGSAISAKSFASREWLPVAALKKQNILLMSGWLKALGPKNYSWERMGENIVWVTRWMPLRPWREVWDGAVQIPVLSSTILSRQSLYQTGRDPACVKVMAG